MFQLTEARNMFYKKTFFKFRKFTEKRDYCFPMNTANLLRTPNLKNIGERLFLNLFQRFTLLCSFWNKKDHWQKME